MLGRDVLIIETDRRQAPPIYTITRSHSRI